MNDYTCTYNKEEHECNRVGSCLQMAVVLRCGTYCESVVMTKREVGNRSTHAARDTE
jgi:hypothetical protein